MYIDKQVTVIPIFAWSLAWAMYCGPMSQSQKRLHMGVMYPGLRIFYVALRFHFVLDASHLSSTHPRKRLVNLRSIWGRSDSEKGKKRYKNHFPRKESSPPTNTSVSIGA